MNDTLPVRIVKLEECFWRVLTRISHTASAATCCGPPPLRSGPNFPWTVCSHTARREIRSAPCGHGSSLRLATKRYEKSGLTVTGTLDWEERDELLAFLNEMRLPYQKHGGVVGIAGTISPECVDECLSLFYDGRAEVHLSIPLNKK